VSRLTLRSAISRLEAEGLVLAVHGSGTRVLDYRERGGVDLIGYLASQAMDGGVVPFALLRDLLEMRRMIAVELLALVVERATDDDLALLRAHLAHQRTLLGDTEAFKRADLAFARLLVRAGKNLALELLSNTIVRIIEAHPGLDIAFAANAEQTLTVYARLLELLTARDNERVVRVADRLLRHLDHRTLARVSELTGQTVDFERNER
jgi:DNA-binding FadR family transcriptional regulator